jgi:hypothetical protein
MRPRPVAVKGRYISGEPCARCGYLDINVRHEQDPEHAPEGFDYFRPFLKELHEFVPLLVKP